MDRYLHTYTFVQTLIHPHTHSFTHSLIHTTYTHTHTHTHTEMRWGAFFRDLKWNMNLSINWGIWFEIFVSGNMRSRLISPDIGKLTILKKETQDQQMSKTNSSPSGVIHLLKAFLDLRIIGGSTSGQSAIANK